MAPSDEELLAVIGQGTGAAGNPAAPGTSAASGALGQLYDRYGRRAWTLAHRICGDGALAEDAVQEAFLAVWRQAGGFDPARGKVSSWLLTLVHHRAVDLVRREDVLRRRTAGHELDEQQLPPVPGADGDAVDAVVAGSVRAALAGLPDDQRRALALAYFGGYTQREVASLTGVPLGTVKSRMFAGLARLRGSLSPLVTDGNDGRGTGRPGPGGSVR